VESTEKKVLLFVTDAPENLKSVLSFLNKRNFSVFVENEIKSAAAKVFEIKPDFLFIAWDHRDKKIMMLPQVLEKAAACTFVPFINKNTKESVFKFDSCPIIPKLYPPISGPAIERLILKHNKDDQESIDKMNKFKSMDAGSEEFLIVQNNLNQLAENSSDDDPSTAPNEQEIIIQSKPPVTDLEIQTTAPDQMQIKSLEQEPASTPEQQKLTQEIENRNKLLDTPRIDLTEKQKESIRESLQNDIEAPLTDVLKAREAANWNEDNRPQLTEADSETISEPKIPEFYTPEALINSEIQKNIELDNLPDQKYSPPPEVLPPEALPPEAFPLQKPEANTEKQQVYCFSIIFESWCGYFVISTKSILEYDDLDLVFTEWLKEQFPQLSSITEKDFFEFQQVDFSSIQEVKGMAELTEKIEANGQTFVISLFSVQPDDMKIEFSPDKNYIQLNVEDIPTDLIIEFDLYLHFPENKKYLHYIQKNYQFSTAQKSRLLSKNVSILFTSIACEQEYRKYLLRRTFIKLYEQINSWLTSN
jgi:hypothetical protein